MPKGHGGAAAVREVNLEAIRQATEEGEALSGLVEYLGDHPFIRNRVTHVVHFEASRDFEEACWWARTRDVERGRRAETRVVGGGSGNG